MPERIEHESVMIAGVTGSGKTTIGNQIAARLGVPFADADDFHPDANVEKMAAGHPLTNEDRRPWLDACGEWLAQHADGGCVMACSALRRSYREQLRRHSPSLVFVQLDGPIEVATRRVVARLGHFMPAELVRSQYDTLEPLQDGERGIVVSFDQPVADVVAEILDRVGRTAP